MTNTSIRFASILYARKPFNDRIHQVLLKASGTYVNDLSTLSPDAEYSIAYFHSIHVYYLNFRYFHHII